jgi:hypothetical protein
MSEPMFLTLNELIERYRGQVSEGAMRDWRSVRVGPSFLKIGKAVLYPMEELDRWDRRNLIVCRPLRPILIDDINKWRGYHRSHKTNAPCQGRGHNGSDKD